MPEAGAWLPLPTSEACPTAGRATAAPNFLTQVQTGKVASMASKGDTIQGTFRTAMRYATGNPQAPDNVVRNRGPHVCEQRSAGGAAAVPQGSAQLAVDSTDHLLAGALLLGRRRHLAGP